MCSFSAPCHQINIFPTRKTGEENCIEFVLLKPEFTYLGKRLGNPVEGERDSGLKLNAIPV
jgi:hypothetical protein